MAEEVEGMTPEEEALRLTEREAAATEAIEAMELANRQAQSAFREWAAALSQIARKGINIGDTLLTARDRAERNP